LARAKRLRIKDAQRTCSDSMEHAARSAGNRLRQENEKLLRILIKLARKAGGFGKLKAYGLDEEDAAFLKEKFQAQE